MTPRRYTTLILVLALLVVGSASAPWSRQGRALAADAASPSNPLLDAVERLRGGKAPPPAPQNFRLLPSRAHPGTTPPPWSPAPTGALYVAPTGSDSNSGTASAPFRTINRGVRALRSGQTLVVGPGRYDEVLSDVGGPPGYSPAAPPNGRAGAYTTIKAAQPGTVRLRMTRSGSEVNAIVNLHAAAYLRIEGLVVDAESQASGVYRCIGLDNPAHHIQLVDLVCPAGSQGLTGNGSDIEVLGGHYHSAGQPGCYGRGVGDGSQPGYCHGAYLHEGGRRWRIKGATFRGNSGSGLQSYQQDMVIEDSVFSGNSSWGVVGHGGEVRNSCFEGNHLAAINCERCVQSGNRINQGACAAPASPR